MKISHAETAWWVSWIYYRPCWWRCTRFYEWAARCEMRQKARGRIGEGRVWCVVNAFGGDYSMSKLNVPKLQLLSAVSREIECMSPGCRKRVHKCPMRQLLHSFRRDTCQLLPPSIPQSCHSAIIPQTQPAIRAIQKKKNNKIERLAFGSECWNTLLSRLFILNLN